VLGAWAGGWVVVMGKSELVGGAISYFIPSKSGTQNLVFDLEPNATYTVTIGQTRQTLTTSPLGSLRFLVRPGPVNVDLTPAH
jgi:hypothetical protein